MRSNDEMNPPILFRRRKSFIICSSFQQRLGFLSDEEVQNDYNNALKKYLEDKNIDREPISKQEFISMQTNCLLNIETKLHIKGKR